MNGGALRGITVVDLTQALAGPYCTMLLADHGAEVLKVEPLTGDTARWFPPRPDEGLDPFGFGGYFQSINRNKRSIALDLKHPEGRAVVLELAKRADIVVENFRPGVMDRLGLGYEVLAADNPGLVYGAVRGFGDTRTGMGPLGDQPAFDLIAQAIGGSMSITGPPGQPMKTGPGVGDIFPAVLCAFGILAAIQHRTRTGEGQYVDVAMYDAMVALCERIVYQHSYTGAVPAPMGNEHPLLSVYDVFATADGLVAIAAPTDDLWRRLAPRVGGDGLVDDDRFLTGSGRIQHADELRSIVGQWTAERSTAEVLAVLDGIPAAPVQNAAQVVADPQLRARDMLVEVDHPGMDRPVTIAGVPVKLTATPGSVVHRAPRLGEHTSAVLAELGYGGEAQRLLDAGTARQAPSAAAAR